jgi:lipoic acid synthetase
MKTGSRTLEIIDLGLMPYDIALNLQKEMVLSRIAHKTPDRLLFVEHPAVVSIGRSGGNDDLRLTENKLRQKGISVFRSDRGGKATFHGPGQLVAYPIIKLPKKDVHWYVSTLLDVIVSVLKNYGLEPELKDKSPGVWIENRKIASIGITIKKWVALHGIALNVKSDLSGFDCIVPCGDPSQIITSMEKELAGAINLDQVKTWFAQCFKEKFGYSEPVEKRPPHWLTVSARQRGPSRNVESLIREMNLSTVCQSAQCPNITECFNNGTATFMILGQQCTRNCRFCAVEKGIPLSPDTNEPRQVAAAVRKLGLKYAVITSVTRDDLTDGGAEHFAETIRQIRHLCPDSRIGILVPDFSGSLSAIKTVCEAKPDMFNHNIETVRRLYPGVRPQAQYDRSLRVLAFAGESGLPVKSGLMLGLGELENEVVETLNDLRNAGCSHLTLGQYLSPSKKHYPVARYVSPGEFEKWKRIALSMNFIEVASGPLIRSSYRAEQFYKTLHHGDSHLNCRGITV